jgi:hypothetical protein
MGVVPIRVDIMGGKGEMAARPALGVALGGTAGTRRSMEGTRTGRGIRFRPTSSSGRGGFRAALFACDYSSGADACRCSVVEQESEGRYPGLAPAGILGVLLVQLGFRS